MSNLAAACIGAFAFIPEQKQGAGLPGGGIQYLGQESFEPGIARTNPAIVHIMAHIGGNPDKIWQLVSRQVAAEVRKWNNIGAARSIVADVIKIDEGIMPLSIASRVPYETG